MRMRMRICQNTISVRMPSDVRVDSGRDPWKSTGLGLGWEKNLQEWGGEGDKGGGGGGEWEKNWGNKTEGEKRKGKKGGEEIYGDREN